MRATKPIGTALVATTAALLVAMAGLLMFYNSPKVFGQDNSASSNAFLTTLSLSGVVLEHDSNLYPTGFHPLLYDYTASVAHSLTETTVTPTTNHSAATYVIKLGGVTDSDGVIPLSVGTNVITIEVTAEDGQTTQTYTVTVARAPAPSTDATLSRLALSGIDIGSGVGQGASGQFQTSFTANVYHSVSQTTVSPTLNQSGASYVIKLGGVADSDGVVSLAVGTNTITVEVTAEDTTTTKTYTATINRATASASTTGELSTDAPPVNFQVDEFSGINPIISFGVPRNRDITGWVLQRYEHDGDSFVSSGSDWRSEYSSSEDIGGAGLRVGDTIVEPGALYKWVLMLTNSQSSTVIEASLTVRIPISSDASLSALTLSGVDFGAFASSTTSYTAQVANSVSQTTVTPTVSHSGASHVIKLGGVTDADGVIDLSVGSNVITVEVTAEDGQTTQTYTVAVTRAASERVGQENNPATGAPRIEGAVQLDEVLTVCTWRCIDDADGMTNVTFLYQWIRRDGTTDTNIDGATSGSYTIVAADVGKTLKVRVSFDDDRRNTETLTSAYTATVSGQRNSDSTGLPTISGTAQVGQKLTVDTSGINDADGLTNASYGGTWSAGEGYLRALIAAGHDLSYTVSRRDVGMTLEISVNFRDDAGKSVFLDSAPTVAVTPTSPAAPESFTVSQNNAGDLELSWEEPTWDLAGEISGDGTWGDGGSRITGYVVQWKKAADSWSTAADVSEATETGTSHTIEGLTNGVEYAMRVLAVNDVGRGIPSIETTATVGRPASSDASLSALTLSGVDYGTFASGTTSYTAQVANSASQTTVTPTVNHSGATHVIKLGGVTDADGVIDLSVGSNVITVEVTAEDGQTTQTYTVTVTRQGASSGPPPPQLSSDASLSALTLSGVDFGAFASGTTSYSAQVANTVSQTTVTPTVNHSGASHVIKLGGVTDADGVIDLSVGSNVITVEVTAEDGQTTQTYTVTVTRQGASSDPPPPQLSSDASLSALTLSGVDYGAFASATTSYSAQVANSVSQTTVTPTVNHSGASHVIKLGGVADADGVIDLSVGSNVITVEVTAEDGQTTQTYTVTVTRQGASPLAADPCTDSLGTLSGTISQAGAWADDCQSEVSGRGYARYYTFALAQDTEVTINLTSSVDTYLYLREDDATSGTALHDNDDIENGNLNSRIVANLETGTYTIEATTYAADTTGNFTLNVSGGGQTPVATGCTPASLTLPASGESGSWADDCQSQVSGRGYARYYTFTLAQDTEVTINLTSSVDTYLYLREDAAASGTALHDNDDIESGNLNSRIVATLSAGTYTIEATTYAEDATGNFTLNVSGGGQTPVAMGCTPTSLTLPASGVPGSWADDCQSQVSGRGYARYYTFTLTSDGQVTIDLTSSVDTYLYLREDDATSGTSLHSNDDIESGNLNSRIVATLSAGTYTVEATTYAQATTGSFTLGVSTE